jgi:hypothetical protein
MILIGDLVYSRSFVIISLQPTGLNKKIKSKLTPNKDLQKAG